jgi:hypothetical protein
VERSQSDQERPAGNREEIELAIANKVTEVLKAIITNQSGQFMPTSEELSSLKNSYQQAGGDWNDEEFYKKAGILEFTEPEINQIRDFFKKIGLNFDDDQQRQLYQESHQSAEQILEDLTTGDGYAQIIVDGKAQQLQVIATKQPVRELSTVANGGLTEFANLQSAPCALGNGLVDLITRGGILSRNNNGQYGNHLDNIRRSLGALATTAVSNQPPDAIDPGYTQNGQWIASTSLYAYRGLSPQLSNSPPPHRNQTQTNDRQQSPETHQPHGGPEITDEVIDSIFNSIAYDGIEHGGILGTSDGGRTIDKFQRIECANPNVSVWTPDSEEQRRVIRDWWDNSRIDYIGTIHSHYDGDIRLSNAASQVSPYRSDGNPDLFRWGDYKVVKEILDWKATNPAVHHHSQTLYFPLLVKERSTDPQPTLIIYQALRQPNGQITIKAIRAIRRESHNNRVNSNTWQRTPFNHQYSYRDEQLIH